MHDQRSTRLPVFPSAERISAAELPTDFRCHCMPDICARSVSRMAFSLEPFRRAPQLGIANNILDYVVEAFDEIVDPLPLFHKIAKRAVELLAISIARYRLKRRQRRWLCVLGHMVTSPRLSASLLIQLIS